MRLRTRQEAIEMAYDQLLEFPELRGWKVSLTDLYSLHAAGRCRYAQKIIEIDKEYALATDDKWLINTIKHEIAHALLPPKSDPHDREWEEMAKSVGCIQYHMFSVLGHTKKAIDTIEEYKHNLFFVRNEIRDQGYGWVGSFVHGGLEVFILHDDKDPHFEVVDYLKHFQGEVNGSSI